MGAGRGQGAPRGSRPGAPGSPSTAPSRATGARGSTSPTEPGPAREPAQGFDLGRDQREPSAPRPRAGARGSTVAAGVRRPRRGAGPPGAPVDDAPPPVSTSRPHAVHRQPSQALAAMGSTQAHHVTTMRSAPRALHRVHVDNSPTSRPSRASPHSVRPSPPAAWTGPLAASVSTSRPTFCAELRRPCPLACVRPLSSIPNWIARADVHEVAMWTLDTALRVVRFRTRFAPRRTADGPPSAAGPRPVRERCPRAVAQYVRRSYVVLHGTSLYCLSTVLSLYCTV